MRFKRPESAAFFAKLAIAYGFAYSGLTHFLETRRDRRYPSSIRIVSYHQTDRKFKSILEKQFRFFAEHYIPASWNDLTTQIDGTRKWQGKKQGLLFAFDDGGISNFTVARPLLRRYGFTGLFLIPTDWIDTSPEKQAEFAADHRISTARSEQDHGLAMTWDQIRQLVSEGDKIVSHTRIHHRFSSSDSPELLQREILESKQILEKRLGIPIDTFAWVGGETEVYQRSAFEVIQKAGYHYLLSTVLGLNDPSTDPMLIRRTALQDNWPLELLRFWLLPVSDKRYHAKELKIRRQLGIPLSENKQTETE